MLSEKITLEQVNELLGILADLHWDYGEDGYSFHNVDKKIAFLVENNIDLTPEEYESLSDLTCTSMVRKGKADYMDLHVYDDELEPDNRTPEQIREDRLKEYTPEQIAEFGLRAFEIMIDEEFAGKYTFDAIWNDSDVTPYEGSDNDPVNEMVEANIDLRIDVARRANEYLALFAIVDRALMNGGKILAADLEQAGTIIEKGDEDDD